MTARTLKKKGPVGGAHPHWEEGPPQKQRGRYSSLWAARVEVLKNNPNRWGKWTGYSPKSVYNQAQQLKKRFGDEPVTFKAVVNERGQGEIWAMASDPESPSETG